MQPVNDDMDNLFRRAAESYPLKSDGADFNKIKQLLDAGNDLPQKKSKKQNYLWLLLLLLVPLAFLLGRYYTADTNKKDQIKTSSNTQQETITPNLTDTTNNITANIATVENKNNTPVINVDKESKIQQPKKVDVAKQQDNHQSSNANNRIAIKQHIVTTKTAFRKSQNNSVAASNQQHLLKNSGSESALLFAEDKGNKEKMKFDNLSEKKEELSKKNSTVSADISKVNNTKPDTNIADSLHKTLIKNTLDTSTAVTKETINFVNQTTSKKTAEKNKIKKKLSVYIGVITGPDASTVKSNKSSGTGYNIGFIAGYHTGKHLAFETGISWNYKKYYSDGKHVSVEKLGLIQHTNIIYLEGNCGMIELPVNIKYHFNTKGNHNWYTGAGISSYIMKKENYDYLSSRYGIEYYGEKEYRNTTTNWLSVLQFNVGYQLNINKVITLRIEPYAKLPLHGLGIGKLPISSAGLNVGATLPIH